MKTWFSISASAAPDTADVTIFDEIGMWGVTARDLLAQIAATSASNIRVLINSPGGSVVDALAIYNGLRQSGKTVTCEVLGIAASAASFIAMAGDKVVMPENTFMFLHNPVAGAYGNAQDMREMADVLDKFGASLKATYMRRFNGSAEALDQILADETWLTAAECLAYGLADEVSSPVAVTASFDLDRPMPDAVRALLRPPEPAAPPAVEPAAAVEPIAVPSGPTLADQIKQAADAAGLGILAEALVLDASMTSIDAVQAALGEAREVRALLAAVGEQAREGEFLVARRPLADVRQALAAERAARDVPIVSARPTEPAATAASKPSDGGFNVVAFWKSHQEKRK